MVDTDRNDPILRDLKRIEGRRWHRERRLWSVPASLRSWWQLEKLGVEMLAHGGGQAFLAHLVTGQDYPTGGEDPRLWPFQKRDVAWLKAHPFALNANEQGLGKTVEEVLAFASEPRIVVVAPLVTLAGWERTIHQWLGAETPVAVREPTIERGWLLVNYEYLPKLTITPPYALIVDEVHRIANPKTRRTKQVLLLGEGAHKIHVCSGTPLRTKRPIQLWPLYLLLRERIPQEFFPWVLRYTGAYHNDFGWDFTGATNLDELAQDLRAFAIRHEKAEVLPDLPPKVYTTVVTDGLSKTVSALDTAVLSHVASGHSIVSGDGLADLQRLRVETSMSKVGLTTEWLKSRDLTTEKVVVFFEFLAPLEAVAEGVSAPDIQILRITGAQKDKGAVERQFWDDPQANLLLCTYGAGGEGVNLQCAHTVVIHDLPMTPDVLVQAEDRLHRGGQKDSVHVVTMLSPSRVEARMIEGLRAHRTVIEALITPLEVST